jgi:hypothetical protein
LQADEQEDLMADPIRGKVLRWTYEDGPVAGKTFEHSFSADGTVTFHEVGKPPSRKAVAYEVERIDDNVYVVSYLNETGWALTSVLDRKSGKLTSIASNEKQLHVQHGTFAQPPVGG